ncbi:protein sprouty homolog 1-like [Paramormyrops kingsleyae]|uniref:protein sprouty homolog 1-like n=1 Tax=Paramormyrops kingsleyae TaxID=1676925 RepID=UPI003B979D95
MEVQSQHGPGGVLVVIQQPPRGGRTRLDRDREVQRPAVLSLDQIKAIRSSNEYTEGPAVARRPPCRTGKPERTHEVVGVNNNCERGVPVPPRHVGRAPPLSRSTSSGSSGSGCSERGLLGRSPPSRPERGQPPVLTQPGPGVESLKPAVRATDEADDAHRFICERCGRCKCGECTAPRTLPSCLACRGLCLCSADSAVENATCMCLVRALFYHCSDDDQGDSCADSPCSLSRPHCCSRFLSMGLLSGLLPCLLCYPPGKGCVRACQGCYDRARRPGCRCKHSNTVYCKLENWSPKGPAKAS